MGRSNWLIAKKKKVGLVRHPQLINVKQNKYTYMGQCCLQGVLAQAKTGDKLFWEEKFHAANGKATSTHSRCLVFFSLWGGGGGGGGELYISKEDNICQSIWDKSEVLQRTCWGTHWEPDQNPLGTWRQHSENTLRTRKKWNKTLYLKNRTFYIGELFLFWVIIGQSNRLITKKTQISTWEAPHLINRRGD